MTRKELVEQIMKKRSFLCVGLDTDIKKIPEHLLDTEDPIFEFNKAIIDATSPYCVAYKPNLAFYEALGAKGQLALEKTVAYLKKNYPEQFIIADAKRGDIGNTSKLYARSFFEYLDVDAVTVAPYMGEDSVTPFLGYEGKWVILLALTSNKGSHDFQLIRDENGTPLFESVIKKSQEWASTDEMMYVVGATQGKMFEDIRRVAPKSFLLVPGVGAQGGSHDFQLIRDENGTPLFESVIKKSQEWASTDEMMYVVGATQGKMFEDIRRVAPKSFLLVPGVGAQGGSLEEVCRYGMIDDCGLLVNSSRGIIYASTGTDFAEVAGTEAKKLRDQMDALL